MNEEELMEFEQKSRKDEKTHWARFMITKEMNRKFKAHCANEGLSMQIVLESLLAKYMEDIEKE